MNPTVSVVMITYLHEKYIRESIEGILMQQCNFNVELIIADDNSPDNTADVVHDLMINHKYGSWIRYYKNEKNKGAIPNFEWALKQSKGKYIAVCEGDDYWTDPLKLQKQVDFLETHPEFVLTYHPWRNLEENKGEKVFHKISFSTRTCTLLFRNLLNDLPGVFSEAPNGDTFLRFYLKQYGKFKLIEDIEPAVRRIHEGGIMSTLSSYHKLPRRIKTHEILLKAYKDTNRAPEIIKTISKFKIEYALMGIYFDEKGGKLSKLKDVMVLAIRNGQIIYAAKTFLRLARKQRRNSAKNK